MILPTVRVVFVGVLFILTLGVPKGPVNAQTATPTSTPTQTPTPTTPPNNAPYCASLTSDITTATGTPQTITLSCAGVDPSGDITGAEFVFGDGTRELVEKNVGSPGSISVTHIYTTIGTLGVSCRTRDNDMVFSPPTDACKRIITIRPKATSTIAATTGTIATTPSPTPLPITTIEITPEPTIDIQPTLYPEDTYTDETVGSNRIWWILGGVVSVLVGFLLLRRKKPTPPMAPPQPPMGSGQAQTPAAPPPQTPMGSGQAPPVSPS